MDEIKLQFAIEDTTLSEPPVMATIIRNRDGMIEVRVSGYGEHGADGQGSVLAMELRDGILQLHVFGDINVEGPTQTVDLSGASESNRTN